MKKNKRFWLFQAALARPLVLIGVGCFLYITAPVVCHGADTRQIAFDASSINASVMSALETNPRLDELKQNREAVKNDLKQTRGRYYPRVDLDVGYGADSHSDTLTRIRDEENDFEERSEASISLVQPLFQGGEIHSSVGVQLANLESVDKRVFDNAEALALDAIIAHLEVSRQRKLMDLTNQNVKAHRQILAYIKERQRAGAGTTADVTQTNGRLALTLASRFQIEADLEAANANYFRVVGRYPQKLALPVDFRSWLPSSKEDALSRAESCNPKLAALAADIRAAKKEIDVRKSNFFPKINLELSSTYRDQVESDETYEQNNAAMIRASWNLFSGGSDVAARDAAAARKRQAVFSRNDQYERIAELVHDTWSRYKIAGEQVKTYAEAVEYNRQTREAYQQQFIVGQRSLLDVLDAENEFFQSSGQLITARINEVIAAYRLRALMGCLLRSLDLNTESLESIGVPTDCCSELKQTRRSADGALARLKKRP